MYLLLNSILMLRTSRGVIAMLSMSPFLFYIHVFITNKEMP